MILIKQLTKCQLKISKYIFRIGNNYTNRKKNLIKEWAKTNTSNSGATNGGGQPPSANDVAISGSSRSFLGNDFAYPSSSGIIIISPKLHRSNSNSLKAFTLNPLKFKHSMCSKKFSL